MKQSKNKYKKIIIIKYKFILSYEQRLHIHNSSFSSFNLRNFNDDVDVDKKHNEKSGIYIYIYFNASMSLQLHAAAPVKCHKKWIRRRLWPAKRRRRNWISQQAPFGPSFFSDGFSFVVSAETISHYFGEAIAVEMWQRSVDRLLCWPVSVFLRC